MDFDTHCMFILPTELSLFNYDKVKSVLQSIAPLITVKKNIAMTEEELVTQFQNRLFKFRRHLFNIRWQYSIYRTLRENLTNDCLIHIDFSENFTCKYASEIQSVHFRGSHKQVTLHTGVLYVGKEPPISFCTISPSRRHDPASIWAHLDPILDMLKRPVPCRATPSLLQ